MKKIRLKNKIMAMAVGAITLITAFSTYRADAAGYIDDTKTCSVTISLPDTVTDMEAGDKTCVYLYEIGSIDNTGLLRSAEGLDITYKAGMNAADMLSAIEKAKKWVADNNKVEAYSFDIDNSKQGSTTGDVRKAIYLLTVDNLVTKRNTYTFESAILSLPSNTYGIAGSTSDAWIYDVSQTVKCESQRNLVDLTIQKNLPKYNASLGKASFVFKVTAYDSDDTIVFSDVYSINMDEAGQASVNTGKVIPTDCKIVVEEVYSGASYTIDSEDNKTITLENGLFSNSTDKDRTVTFTNNYNKKLISSGISITNTYTKTDDGYIAENDLPASDDAAASQE